MKTLRFALAPLAATAVAFAITPARPRTAVASSHAEAPAIADDPAMDNTDVWAWQDNTGATPTITIVTAWNGVSTPSGGPNYKKWVPYPQGIYEIHIDGTGTGVEGLTYQFRFNNVDNGDPTFLRVTSPSGGYGQLTSAGDTKQKFRQTYSVAAITGRRRANNSPALLSNGATTAFAVAPPNTGPKLTLGRAGGFNASIPGTFAVTNGATAATVNVNAAAGLATALTAGEVIEFGSQAGTTYTVAATAAAGATTFTLTSAYTGPANTATTVLTRGPNSLATLPGTVALTNGSPSVTGTATTFTALAVGEALEFASQQGTTYTIASIANDTTLTLASNFTGATIASDNALGDYEAVLAHPAIQTMTSGEKIFVGPRGDAFFVDLGPTFDRLKIRTALSPPGIANAGTRGPDVGQYGGAFNTLSGKNVECIAIQIPVAKLPGGGGFTLPTGSGYVGVWASSSRSKIRVLPINNGPKVPATSAGGFPQSDVRESSTGSFVQVSRLGNPLVNELFIPFDLKDAWNADVPENDAQHWAQYFSNPEVAGIINAVYSVPIPPTPRNDLQFLFAPDTLKVRTNLAAPLTASSPAFVVSATPLSLLLGRTFADDVVDIYLNAAAGILVIPTQVNGGPAGNGGFGIAGAFGMPAFIPPSATSLFGAPVTAGLLAGQPINGLLGDGVEYGTDGSAAGFRVTPTTFPYMPTPWDGQEVGNDYFQTPRHN